VKKKKNREFVIDLKEAMKNKPDIKNLKPFL